ncbi:hypothetical protein SprV_0401728900 [Sparganum proliferum]
MAPAVLIEALANFDETTLRPFALQNVDSLTTRKLCNGYPLLDFKLTYAAFDGLDSTVITSSLKRAAPASEANELSADTDTINENNGHDVEAAKRARNEENINDTTVKVKPETNVGTNSSPAAATAGAATTTEPVNKQKEDTATKLATPTSSTVSTNRGDSTGSSGKGGQASGNRYNNPRNRGYRNQQQQHNRNQQMQRFDGNTPVRQQQGARLSPSRRRGTDNQREMSPPRRQSGGGLRSAMHQESQLQMAARLLSPGLAMRQGGQSLANSMTLIGGGGQSSPGNTFRMPLPQRLSGSGQQGQSPNQMMSAQLAGGFGGMSQQQSFGSGGGNGGGNSAWPMLSSAAAQGLRMAGLQHPQQQQCRMCGAQNPMNMMFCRNCRSPNR